MDVSKTLARIGLACSLAMVLPSGEADAQFLGAPDRDEREADRLRDRPLHVGVRRAQHDRGQQLCAHCGLPDSERIAEIEIEDPSPCRFARNERTAQQQH